MHSITRTTQCVNVLFPLIQGSVDVAVTTSLESPVTITDTPSTNLFPTPTSDVSMTSDLPLVAMSTMSQPSSTTNTVTSMATPLQFPSLTPDLLADYPIHPGPLSLLPTPHPDKYVHCTRTCNMYMYIYMYVCNNYRVCNKGYIVGTCNLY